MIDKEHRLSIGRQARLLSLSRGSVYYLPRPVPVADLAVMNRIDKLHLEYLRAIAQHSLGSAGSRMIPEGRHPRFAQSLRDHQPHQAADALHVDLMPFALKVPGHLLHPEE
jgi:hypothetical protein